MTTGATTTRDLLDSDILAGSEVLGGHRGVDAEASGVVVWELADPATHLAARGDVVVVTSSHAEPARGPALDVVIRKAKAASASLVVLPPQRSEVALATRRLTDRLAMPAMLPPASATPVELIATLHRLVHDADIHDSHTLLAIAGALSGAPQDPGAVVSVIETGHTGSAAVVTRSHGVLAGDLQGVQEAQVTQCRVIQTLPGPESTALVYPVRVTGSEPTAWLVLSHPSPTRRWLELSRRVSAITEGSLVAALALGQMTEERATRERGRILSEILHSPDDADPDLAETARQVGLHLAGWHVGLHIMVLGPEAEVPAFSRLDTAIRCAVPAVGPFVERGDGWSAWMTTTDIPSPAQIRHLIGQATEEIRTVTAAGTGLRACIGVGAAQRDAAGVAQTLVQARQAALVASSSGTDVSVRVVQDLGASRLLLGWYGSGAFRDLAEEILTPLVALGDPELVHTLAAYLDRACSASHTARFLGVHRNTVNQRVRRAEQALSVTVNDPDTRLALQLAMRARRAGSAPTP